MHVLNFVLFDSSFCLPTSEINVILNGRFRLYQADLETFSFHYEYYSEHSKLPTLTIVQFKFMMLNHRSSHFSNYVCEFHILDCNSIAKCINYKWFLIIIENNYTFSSTQKENYLNLIINFDEVVLELRQ